MNHENETAVPAPSLGAILVAAMATDTLHRETVNLGGDNEATVYVAELPDAQFRKILGKATGYDRADLIAEAIRDENGAKVLTVEQAGKLRPKIARALEEAAMRGSGFDAHTVEAAGNA